MQKTTNYSTYTLNPQLKTFSTFLPQNKTNLQPGTLAKSTPT